MENRDWYVVDISGDLGAISLVAVENFVDLAHSRSTKRAKRAHEDLPVYEEAPVGGRRRSLNATLFSAADALLEESALEKSDEKDGSDEAAVEEDGSDEAGGSSRCRAWGG